MLPPHNIFWFWQSKKAQKYAQKLDFPLIVKPVNGSLSHHVSIISNLTELLQGIQIAKKYEPQFMIEKFVQGSLIRVNVIARKKVFVCQRIAANIIGNGKSSIADLIKAKNEERNIASFTKNYWQNESKTKKIKSQNYQKIQKLSQILASFYKVSCGFIKIKSNKKAKSTEKFQIFRKYFLKTQNSSFPKLPNFKPQSQKVNNYQNIKSEQKYSLTQVFKNKILQENQSRLDNLFKTETKKTQIWQNQSKILKIKTELKKLSQKAKILKKLKSTKKHLSKISINKNSQERNKIILKPTLRQIVIDQEMVIFLAKSGLNLQSVPPQNQQIFLNSKITLSRGADVLELTQSCTIEIKNYFVKIAELLEADLVGFDLLCDDVTLPIASQNFQIIEANSCPYLNIHEHPSSGNPQKVAQIVWQEILDNPKLLENY